MPVGFPFTTDSQPSADVPATLDPFAFQYLLPPTIASMGAPW